MLLTITVSGVLVVVLFYGKCTRRKGRKKVREPPMHDRCQPEPAPNVRLWEDCMDGIRTQRSVEADIMQVNLSKLEVLEKELVRERELKQCVVCLDRPRKVMIIPCNHYCLCQECERRLDKCPICTKRIRRVEQIFDS